MKILKKLSILCVLFLSLNVFTACSSKDASSNSPQFYASTSDNSMNEEYYSEVKAKEGFTQLTDGDVVADSVIPVSSNVNANSVSSNRKLIRRIHMSVETLFFDKAMDAIMDEVNRLGGYSESSNINGSGYNNSESRYASLTLRIPSNQVEQLLSLVGEQANVLSKKETSEDVTLSYVDTQSRVKSLEIQQERLLVLLEKADSLKDIITLEQRLSEVRYEIEEYASRLRTYDNLVEYSTLSLEIREVKKITPVESKGIINRMGTGISKSFNNVYNGIINFIVWLVVNIPYIIIWGAVIVVIVIIIKKASKVHVNTISKKMRQLPEETKETKEKSEDSNN